jgi:hypothetical protein
MLNDRETNRLIEKELQKKKADTEVEEIERDI